MKTVQYSRHGGPEVLELVENDAPVAGPGQVRVAVRAVGLNPFDYKVRNTPGFLPDQVLPSGQGNEFAGVVDAVGDGVTQWTAGDEVLGWGSRTQAELLVVPASHLGRKPAALDWPTAGAIGLVGNTALRAVAAVAPGQGDTVLVGGAAGGVGLSACQFALRAGATVIGTASEANHRFLRELGVIPVSYGDGLIDRLREAAPSGITAAVDTVGRETVEAAIALGAAPQRIDTVAFLEGVEEFGILAVGGGGKSAQELEALAGWAASGEYVMPIAATFPLAQVRQAYERLESRHLLGKVVLLF